MPNIEVHCSEKSFGVPVWLLDNSGKIPSQYQGACKILKHEEKNDMLKIIGILILLIKL
jgi:hypothetical protein